MNETENISATRAEHEAATAYVPSSGADAVKPPARRFSGFIAIAILVLLGGTVLLTVQWLRTRAMLQVNVAEIARDVGALKSQTESLEAHIAALEKSSAETQSVSTQFADLAKRLGALEEGVARAADRDTLAQLQARIAGLESTSPGEMFKLAAATLARANLTRAAEGGGPFKAELEALRAAAPDDPALAILQPMAETAVPTRAMLIARFPDAARAALDAQYAGAASDNFLARFWTSLRRLVRVRRIGDLEGTTVEDRLARAQADCNRGDLAGAVSETRGVTGAAATPLQPWLKDAETRLALDRAIADMNVRIVQTLATPEPSAGLAAPSAIPPQARQTSRP